MSGSKTWMLCVQQNKQKCAPATSRSSPKNEFPSGFIVFSLFQYAISYSSAKWKAFRHHFEFVLGFSLPQLFFKIENVHEEVNGRGNEHDNSFIFKLHYVVREQRAATNSFPKTDKNVLVCP